MNPSIPLISSNFKKYIQESNYQSMQRQIENSKNNKYIKILFEVNYPRDDDDHNNELYLKKSVNSETVSIPMPKPNQIYLYTIPLGFFLLSRYLEKK